MAFDFIYPVGSVQDVTFQSHTLNNMYMDQTYFQTLYGTQSGSGQVSGTTYFDYKFYVPYSYSVSSNYAAVSYKLGNIRENAWNTTYLQQFAGIWATPSPTSSLQSVLPKFQQIKISNYYYGDEIANGSFRYYYLPIVASAVAGSLSSVQTQNVLRFMDVNENFFGPTFAVTSSTALTNNLSGTTTGISVEVLFRPMPQTESGFLWHRWTTDALSGNIISSYSGSATGAIGSYPFYSGNPYYGIGVGYNQLNIVSDSDKVRPYFEFYVYGALSGSNDHYLDLNTGLINEAARTRFFMDERELRILFDGNFHSIRCVWSINPYYNNGRLYLDGNEIQNFITQGTGRTTALNYSLSSTSATPLYFMSKLDDYSHPMVQTPSRYSTYGETKHILVFNTAVTGNYLSASLTSNTDLLNGLGSSSASLRMWFPFNSALAGTTMADVSSNYGLTTNSVSASIVNDVATPVPEGSIDRVFSLLHDRRDKFFDCVYDDSGTGTFEIQRSAGKLFNNEYGLANDEYIGAIFYNNGNALVLNDHYNKDFGLTTQKFVSYTGSNTFTLNTGSGTSWQNVYTSFVGRSYINRKVLSITATSTHFAKSQNMTSYFTGTDGQQYTKSNKKAITGILWFDRNGKKMLLTKFSEPIIKPENANLAFDINLDL